MRSGIFFRTFALFLIIPLFMAILFTLISIPRERDALLESMAAQSRGMISTAAEINANAFVTNDYGAIIDIGIQLLSINPKIRYLLISRTSGPCFVHTPKSWEERPVGDFLCEAALKTSSGIVVSNPIAQERVFTLSYPLQYSGIDWGIAQIGLSPEAFDKGMRDVYTNILTISIISILTSGLLALLFARQLTKPLLHIREVTSRIMEGDLSARALTERNDEIGMLACSLNAMTETMALTQQSIKESKAHLESILASMSEGLIVTDDSATIIMANKAVTHLSGLSTDQLIGSSLFHLFNKEATMPLQNHIENREYSAPLQDEYAVRHSSGEIVPILLSVARIPDSRFTVYVLRDIRDRKRTELELKKLNDDLEKRVAERTKALSLSEEKYRVLIENASESIFVLQSDIITYANEATLNLLEGVSGDIIGSPFTNVIDRADIDRIRQLFDKAASNHESIRLTGFCIRTMKNDLRWLDISTIPIMWEGKPALLNFMTDMTRQRELQSQLLQAQKMEAIGTLAGGLAHDFNNLLMGIQGQANIAQHDLKSEDPIYGRMQRIQDNVQSASRLTQQLLGLARGGKYDIEVIDVNALIMNTLEVFGRTKRELAIVELLSPVRPHVEGDRGQLQQVLLNLFVNAWQAMPDGGELKVSTQVRDLSPVECTDKGINPGQYVLVAVQDNGMGMDKHTQQRIFEPFFSTKEREKGSGLGLASAYGIINNHEGAITVQSELGEGTTMSFYLPLSNSTEAFDENQANRQDYETGSGTILIVDDQEIASEVASDYLQRMGYDTFVVASGAEALQFYSEHRSEIDLIILDMIMPGMSGNETFAALRTIHRDVKVILSSGYSEDGQAAAMLSAGCNGFIQKPFSLRDLSLKVKSVMDDMPRHIKATPAAKTVESSTAGCLWPEKG